MDFRDHHVKKALDKLVGPYRPEKTVRTRLMRIAAIAALAFAVFLGFWIVLYHSTPKPAVPAARKPVSVQVIPAPANRKQ